METEEALAPILDRIEEGWLRTVDCAPGWWPIILELDAALARIDPDYTVHQVKEKWGGLRYYCSLDDSADAQDLIRAAEERALKTCERCGSTEEVITGPRESGYWIRTLCARCRYPGGAA